MLKDIVGDRLDSINPNCTIAVLTDAGLGITLDWDLIGHGRVSKQSYP